MHGECRVTSLTRPWLYTYTWDEAGRLKTVSKNGTLLVTYAYDHHNRRSRKSTTAAATQGAQTILYHYDQDDHLIAETRSDGTPLRTYVWLAERPLTVIEHAALANPPRSLHLQHDHLGTPRLARNDAGVIQWRWDSDGYGTTTPTHDPDGDGKATVINLRFPGQYYDQESGNYYNWNRYYSPRLGRYLSADPIGIEGGANGYGYVEGTPLSAVDPDGLMGHGAGNGGSVWGELGRTDNEMLKKNVPGTDQFFHCMAACRATKKTGLPDAVRQVLNAKEDYWDYPKGRLGLYGQRKRMSHEEMVKDNDADKAANEYGIQCQPNESCEKRCSPLLDDLPPKYRPFMRKYRDSW